MRAVHRTMRCIEKLRGKKYASGPNQRTASCRTLSYSLPPSWRASIKNCMFSTTPVKTCSVRFARGKRDSRAFGAPLSSLLQGARPGADPAREIIRWGIGRLLSAKQPPITVVLASGRDRFALDAAYSGVLHAVSLPWNRPRAARHHWPSRRTQLDLRQVPGGMADYCDRFTARATNRKRR